jgi:DNA-directed RNA polymerase specialized sigma24 family protein
MSELEDFAIIEAIRNGSEKILLRIYSEYRDEFMGWAISNNQLEIEEAKDIFQDTIISFHQNLKSGKQEHLQSSVKTYLFAIGKTKLRIILEQ